jgi:hypothetical protein
VHVRFRQLGKPEIRQEIALLRSRGSAATLVGPEHAHPSLAATARLRRSPPRPPSWVRVELASELDHTSVAAPGGVALVGAGGRCTQLAHRRPVTGPGIRAPLRDILAAARCPRA